VPPARLKLEFQLHALILAERWSDAALSAYGRATSWQRL
jgi:hypothetical protein